MYSNPVRIHTAPIPGRSTAALLLSILALLALGPGPYVLDGQAPLVERHPRVVDEHVEAVELVP